MCTSILALQCVGVAPAAAIAMGCWVYQGVDRPFTGLRGRIISLMISSNVPKSTEPGKTGDIFLLTMYLNEQILNCGLSLGGHNKNSLNLARWPKSSKPPLSIFHQKETQG